ncbi:LysM domain-containing protein-like protein 1 [Seiridium cupressi]
MQNAILTTFLAAFVAYCLQAQAAPALDLLHWHCNLRVQSGDYCNKIRDQFNDTWSLDDFYAWNPEVDNVCSNLYPGEVVCVGMNDTSTVPPACPVPVQPGLVSNCAKCYEAVELDNCYNITEAEGISLDDFHLWNPSIDAACTNILLGYNYCVGV